MLAVHFVHTLINNGQNWSTIKIPHFSFLTFTIKETYSGSQILNYWYINILYIIPQYLNERQNSDYVNQSLLIGRSLISTA